MIQNLYSKFALLGRKDKSSRVTRPNNFVTSPITPCPQHAERHRQHAEEHRHGDSRSPETPGWLAGNFNIWRQIVHDWQCTTIRIIELNRRTPPTLGTGKLIGGILFLLLVEQLLFRFR